jgi:hypothetical protein
VVDSVQNRISARGKNVASPADSNGAAAPTASTTAVPIRVPSRPTSVHISTPPIVASNSISPTTSQLLSAKIIAPTLTSKFKPPRDPREALIDLSSEAMIKIGDTANLADPNKDPQFSLGTRPASREA